ncbi:MAG TPA: outer membrane protein assembly factor BamD [Candidatus Eisenbacteria bacterium]|nr:outer membrane protein assembly factor BamD [Candidatus Eisenbacteria bacterium]
MSWMRRTAWLTPILLLWLAGCGGSVLPQIHSDADRLSTARRLYEDGSYAEAIELLKTYTASAGGADVDAGIYILGQCYLKTREWALAAVEFERVLKDYPESDSAGSAAFRLGEAYWGQSRKPDFDQEYTLKALEQWQNYLANYPDHWLAGGGRGKVLEARTRLAKKLVATGNLYLKLKYPDPAKVYFQRVLDEYGDTSMKPHAMLGLARYEARFPNPDPAIAIYKQIEAEFPRSGVSNDAAHERRRLEKKKKS